MLCRSVACKHKNPSLVNTRIHRHPPAGSPWHVSLAIRWTLVVSPWEYYIAIRSLPRLEKTPSLSAGSLSPLDESPHADCPCKLPRYPLVACCIAVLTLCVRNGTHREEHYVGRLSSRRGTVAYTVIPRLTKIIRSGITFVSRNVISHRFLSRT
jgi:hypothetical protein